MGALIPLDRDCIRCGTPLFAGPRHVKLAARFGKSLNDWPKVCPGCVIAVVMTAPTDETGGGE